MSPEGEDLGEHILKKYGEEARRRFTNPNNPLSAAGSKVGIEFNMSRRIINSTDCHRLMEWCYTTNEAKADDLMEQMFKSYFVEGNDLSKHEQLLNVVGNVEGLSKDDAARVLTSNAFKQEIAAYDMKAKMQRISGVPFFMIQSETMKRPTTFSGAQPADLIAEVLEEAQQS